jgi:Uma2 family endonuclease
VEKLIEGQVAMAALRRASATTEKPLLTVAEFENMPESYGRYELIDGRVIEKPVPTFDHSTITRLILRVYDQFDRTETIGVMRAEVGVLIREGYVPVPDISFWFKERAPGRKQRPAPYPDFAIEIQSPEQSIPSLRKKIKEYFGAGTRLAWLIIPDREQIEIYRAGESATQLAGIEDVLDASDVIPGFSVAVRDLFEE